MTHKCCLVNFAKFVKDLCTEYIRVTASGYFPSNFVDVFPVKFWFLVIYKSTSSCGWSEKLVFWKFWKDYIRSGPGECIAFKIKILEVFAERFFKIPSSRIAFTCSESTMKTSEQWLQWRCSGVFIVNFEQFSFIFLVFPLLSWTSKYRVGEWMIFFLFLLGSCKILHNREFRWIDVIR